MANAKSAKKAHRSSVKKNEINTARKNRIRSFAKKVTNAIDQKDEKKARDEFKKYEVELMKGVTKDILKLNTASRKLKRLSASIRNLKVDKK